MGEAVGDVFKEDEAEYDVFVIGSIKLLAQFIGRWPQFFRLGRLGRLVQAHGLHQSVSYLNPWYSYFEKTINFNFELKIFVILGL